MSARRGFTLIELMLTIALTGIVAVLVYGAAGVALDAETRLSERERVMRSERGWYAVVQDALRNLRPNAEYPQPTLIVATGADPLGRPRDRIQFITAGGMPPLTGDADWTVTLETVDGRASLSAAPIGVRAPARRITGPPGITGLEVRVLNGAEDLEWLDEWSDRRLLPRAIELTFWTDSGPAGPGLLHVVPLEYVP